MRGRAIVNCYPILDSREPSIPIPTSSPRRFLATVAVSSRARGRSPRGYRTPVTGTCVRRTTCFVTPSERDAFRLARKSAGLPNASEQDVRDAQPTVATEHDPIDVGLVGEPERRADDGFGPEGVLERYPCRIGVLERDENPRTTSRLPGAYRVPSVLER